MFKHFIINFSLAVLSIIALCLVAAGSGMLGGYLCSVFGLSFFVGMLISMGVFLLFLVAVLAAIDTYSSRDKFK